jgi:putative transposase
MNQHLAPFNACNTEFAYQLHYHIGFRTRCCVPVLRYPDRVTFLTDTLYAICERGNYHPLELDVTESWVRMLVSLQPSQAPAKFVQTIKSNSSRLLFERYPEIEYEMNRHSLWSRGYYLRSVGSVTNRTIAEYVARQAEHHGRQRGDSRLLASFQHSDPARFFDFRPLHHCVAEYNCHLVFCPLRHVPAVDVEFAAGLLAYMLRVADAREFEVISLAILDDHVHLFAALMPKHSPDHLALTMMNNTSHWMQEHDPGAAKLWKAPGLWAPSAFLRTAGAVTTDVVRYHLRSSRVGE